MNKYDLKYDATLREVAAPSHSYYAPRPENECKEAREGKFRDPSKSELAKDSGYQSFLELATNATKNVLGRHGESISVDWPIGGAEGGNCWGGVAERYTNDEPPAELQVLDKILEAVCPNITFLQYKNLCSEVVNEGWFTRNEYYGNYTEYGVKYCLFSELYAKLKEKGILGNE